MSQHHSTLPDHLLLLHLLHLRVTLNHKQKTSLKIMLTTNHPIDSRHTSTGNDSQDPEICPRFARNQCLHGIRRNKEANGHKCPKSYPRRCKHFCRFVQSRPWVNIRTKHRFLSSRDGNLIIEMETLSSSMKTYLNLA